MEHPIDKVDIISWFTGSCRAEARRRIEEHVSSCISCRRFLQSLQQERDGFLSRFPFEQTIGARQTAVVRHFYPKQLFALAASVLLLAGAGIIYRQLSFPQSSRLKGEAVEMNVYVKTAAGAIESRKEHWYAPGEQIQITYSCAALNRLILLSVDERGTISTYCPIRGDSSVTLEQGAGLPLPNSIILDDYIGKELIVAIFSRRPLSLSSAKSLLTKAIGSPANLQAVSLDAGDSAIVKTLLITKARAEK
jgi:hypothetical protein